MPQKVEVKLLCVENEPLWQCKVQEASNSVPGIHMDAVTTYKDAVDHLNKDFYDICAFDSRLSDQRSRIHQLVNRVGKKPESKRPEVLALTNFSMDIGSKDKNKLHSIVKKNDVSNDKFKLKKIILSALYASLMRQGLCIYNDLASEDTTSSDYNFNFLISCLRKDHLTPSRIRERIEILHKKYEIYQNHYAILPLETTTLLDCFGYVSAVCENQVDVVLLLPNSQKIRRTFSSTSCLSAGIYYQNASFRYTVTQEGAKTTAEIRAEKPSQDYPCVIEMPKVDYSIYDELSDGDGDE